MVGVGVVLAFFPVSPLSCEVGMRTRCSIGAGDASGVVRGLGEDESEPARKVRAQLVARVHAGATTDADAGVREDSGGDASPQYGPTQAAASPPCQCALKFICACERSR